MIKYKQSLKTKKMKKLVEILETKPVLKIIGWLVALTFLGILVTANIYWLKDVATDKIANIIYAEVFAIILISGFLVIKLADDLTIVIFMLSTLIIAAALLVGSVLHLTGFIFGFLSFLPLWVQSISGWPFLIAAIVLAILSIFGALFCSISEEPRRGILRLD